MLQEEFSSWSLPSKVLSWRTSYFMPDWDDIVISSIDLSDIKSWFKYSLSMRLISAAIASSSG